tara:strand:+ start:938 stop:1732 length:795 start_codon:yes stop_codon:yes gene_type:complete
MSNVTVVSALFNIDRVDGRKWDEYLKWFDKTLQLKVPMVLFITEDLVEFVEERRGDLPTELIVDTIDDIPYYHLKDEIQDILDSDEYKENISDPDRIECKQAMYSVIQYSKFPWIKYAVEKNPHDTDYFFWLDAGGSRFFDNFDLTEQWPSKEACKSLEEMGESFLLQMNCDYYPDLYNADELDLDYLYDNRSYVLGSLFGGHKNKIPSVCDIVEDVLINEMINKKNVNNEQIALGYIIKKYSDEFSLYERTTGKHMALFTELA